jgi:IS5 family transposase
LASYGLVENLTNHFQNGCKNHIKADQTNKLVQNYAVTNAGEHDSQVFEELLDPTIDTDGKQRPIYADSAYRSGDCEENLVADGFESQINEKESLNHPLTDEQKTSNRIKLKTRGSGWQTYLAHCTQWAAILCAPLGWFAQRQRLA